MKVGGPPSSLPHLCLIFEHHPVADSSFGLGASRRLLRALRYPSGFAFFFFWAHYLCFIMSSAGPSRSSSAPGTPRRSNVKYVSVAALNLERVYEQNRARLQQRDGALSPTNEQASANAGKGKPRLLLMGQRRYVLFRSRGISYSNLLTRAQEREVIDLKRSFPQSTA